MGFKKSLEIYLVVAQRENLKFITNNNANHLKTIEMILGATKQVYKIYSRKTNVAIPARTSSNKKIKIPP